MTAQTVVMCERCHRMRYEKRMERAVYVRTTLDGQLAIAGQSETYRCLARTSCNTARHQRWTQ